MLVCGALGCHRLWGLEHVDPPRDQALADQLTGCDADLASDDANCGSCGRACPAGHACQATACVPLTCAGILAANAAALDGVYSIDTDGRGAGPAIDVFCDMSNDEGGWTLLISLAPTTVTNGFTSVTSWPQTLPLDRLPPTVSGIYRGSLAPFSEVREEISSGFSTVYGRNLSPAQLEVIRQSYGTQSRTAAAPIYSNVPPCRTSYPAMTDSIVGCTMYSGTNGGDTLGWAKDASGTSCWFARGNCCVAGGGSALCPGEANGTRWARTWFR